jgi:hypothetical protein
MRVRSWWTGARIFYERSREVVDDATHELPGKYRALREYSRQLLDEAETILRRTKSAATSR